jgi:hypothetical protein
MRFEINESEFTWSRATDDRNYEVIKATPAPDRDQWFWIGNLKVAPLTEADFSRIRVKKGAALERYKPLLIPDLWKQFADIEDWEEGINFVKRYGPLTRQGLLCLGVE